YVDQEIISEAALRYGLLEEKLSSLDESRPSLLERFDAETRRCITVLQTALYDFAEQDRVMLQGRAGPWLIRGIPHALRVRVLASRVQVALATNPETRRYRITVEARGGVVTLEGSAALDEAVDVARGVAGVRDVKTQQVDVPPIPPFVA